MVIASSRDFAEGFAERCEKEREENSRHRQLAEYIKQDIERRGLEAVLADMLLDPKQYRWTSLG